MIRVTSMEFGKEVGRYQDTVQAQPGVVTRNGGGHTVMISGDEYRRLKRRKRQVFAVNDLPDDVIKALSNATMDPRHNPLNDLNKDRTL